MRILVKPAWDSNPAGFTKILINLEEE